MATFYSGWASYGSGGQMRLRLEIDDPPVVTSATASVALAGREYLETNSALSDSYNTCAMDGTLGETSGAVSISHGSGGGDTLLQSVSASVATVYGSSVVVSVGASAGPLAAEGRNLSISGSVTIAARPYQVPAAPTGVAATRVSDTQHTVAWTNTSPASASAPYQSINVQRRENLVGPWLSVATLGVVSSWTDNTTVADRRYEYRIVPANTSGSTSSAASAAVSTTPATPSNAVAVKSGANVVVTWTNNATVASAVEVWHQPGVGAWELLTTLAAGAAATYTHTAPSTAVTHTYRVRSVSASPVLQSGYAVSNAVQLAAAPNAPVVTAPTTAQTAAAAITLAWRHNPVDSSAQTKYQTQWRVQGSPTWITGSATTSTTQAQTVAANTFTQGAIIEWQVRTWGVHVDPSPWSATATFETSALPIATITAPAAVHALPTVTPVVGYYQAASVSQAAWEVELRDATGATVETKSGTGAIPGLSTHVTNGNSWTLRARVQSAKGLWSAWVSFAFSIDFPEPAEPTLTAAWNRDNGSVQVTIANPAPAGAELDAASNSVYRRINGGDWVRIAVGVPKQGTFVDRLPITLGTNEYRVDAVSSLGTTTSSAVVAVEVAEPGWMYVNYGPGFATTVKAYGNLQPSGSAGRQKALHLFAGAKKPRLFTGEGRSLVRNVAVRLTPDASPPADWETAAQESEVAAYRDPKGRRIFGSMADFTNSDDTATLASVAFTVTEVGYDE